MGTSVEYDVFYSHKPKTSSLHCA